jgi:hypothetical protein
MIPALVLFLIAAVGGIALVGLRLANKPLPMALALIHGAVAAIGLVLLALDLFKQPSPAKPAVIALVLLVVAALGGFVVFSFHLRRRPIPIPLTIVHALIAVGGVGSLAVAILGR